MVLNWNTGEHSGSLEVLDAEKNYLDSEDVGEAELGTEAWGECQARMGWTGGMSCAPRFRMEELRVW